MNRDTPDRVCMRGRRPMKGGDRPISQMQTSFSTLRTIEFQSLPIHYRFPAADFLPLNVPKPITTSTSRRPEIQRRLAQIRYVKSSSNHPVHPEHKDSHWPATHACRKQLSSDAAPSMTGACDCHIRFSLFRPNSSLSFNSLIACSCMSSSAVGTWSTYYTSVSRLRHLNRDNDGVKSPQPRSMPHARSDV